MTKKPHIYLILGLPMLRNIHMGLGWFGPSKLKAQKTGDGEIFLLAMDLYEKYSHDLEALSASIKHGTGMSNIVMRKTGTFQPTMLNSPPELKGLVDLPVLRAKQPLQD